MTSARFTWQGDEWAKGVLPGALAKAINAGATYTEGQFKRVLQRSATPSQPGQPPRTDKGRLRRSLSFLPAYPGRYKATVGTAIRYARALEFGATITPLTSKYLTVPLNTAAKRMRARNVSLRSVSGESDVYRSKDGKSLILAIAPGKGVKAAEKGIREGNIARFLLVPRITIKPRPFIRPTFERAKPEIMNRIRNSLRANLRAAV